MILLDTNVLSELMRPVPNETVLAWLDRQTGEDVFVSAIAEAEILRPYCRMANAALFWPQLPIPCSPRISPTAACLLTAHRPNPTPN